MRRILSHGLLMFAGVASVTPGLAPDLASRTAGAGNREDPRLETLRSFFAEMDCPALAVSGVFLQASDAYGLDWRLLPSISFIESTGGKNLRNNNLLGWNSGKAEFPSLGGIFSNQTRRASRPQ